MSRNQPSRLVLECLRSTIPVSEPSLPATVFWCQAGRPSGGGLPPIPKTLEDGGESAVCIKAPVRPSTCFCPRPRQPWATEQHQGQTFPLACASAACPDSSGLKLDRLGFKFPTPPPFSSRGT